MILCCGEALIDMLPRRLAGGEEVFLPFPGGSVFNTAVALGRLGLPAGFLGGLSTDFFGDMLRRVLAASGVDVSLAPLSGRPTTLAFVKLAGGKASYAFFDENSAGRMVGEGDLKPLPASVEALHFGANCLIQEPVAATFEALMKRSAADRVITLDPNIRPTLIADRAAYLARIDRLVPFADIVKLSDDDLDWFEERKDAPIAPFARRWLARGPKLVIVTRGPAGAVAFSAAGTVEVPAVPVTVADTVGAGDTFTAGTIAALARGGNLSKAGIAALSAGEMRRVLAFAVRAAAITVSRVGPDPPWARELEA